MMSASPLIAAVITFFYLLSAGHCAECPAETYGECLCGNYKERASHPELLELKKNRTSCVLQVNGTVSYYTAVATVWPREKVVFDLEDLGSFTLEFPSSCGWDLCYVVTESAVESLNGAFAYTSPGIINDELKFISAYDCADGQKLGNFAEIYEASDAVVDMLKNKFGIEVSMDELGECVEDASSRSD